MSIGPKMARVLDALATRGTNAAVSKALGVPMGTVQSHVRKAYYVFDVTPGRLGNHAEVRAARRELLRKWAEFNASPV